MGLILALLLVVVVLRERVRRVVGIGGWWWVSSYWRCCVPELTKCPTGRLGSLANYYSTGRTRDPPIAHREQPNGAITKEDWEPGKRGGHGMPWLPTISSSDLQSLRQTYTLGQALRLDLLRRTAVCPVDSKWTYRAQSTLAQKQDPHETARARLKPLIDDFEAPIDYAVAYGSGVIHQANKSDAGEVRPSLIAG